MRDGLLWVVVVVQYDECLVKRVYSELVPVKTNYIENVLVNN